MDNTDDILQPKEENDNPQARPAESGRINTDGQFKTFALEGMYENWFLDYASYVILERAVPDVIDGLKPVQRRILHAMREMDDGRYNKVANIIGSTMKYHPHGDASIGDALVQLGQKELLIDMQGNWGNVLTGDSAAAARYIEARLSKFALEVVFNPKTTNWKDSYDGRNREPLALPVKFPLLLAQGVEGIAVGLASKIVPHNFNELIDAAINYLMGKDFEILPDFPSGGYGDFSKYNNGLRGGKIRVRAKIQLTDKKTLTITEIPFGTNTSTIIDSIVTANDKGKIKIKKIDDNTADKVEIVIQLAPGISPDQTIDALYAFTNCEVSISPNAAVIHNGKPRFMSVDEILKVTSDHTVYLLKWELEILRGELLEEWHFSSLEKIFIQERIYRNIEEAESWEEVIAIIDQGLEPFKYLFKREITRDDIAKLTEIRIKRISKYNSFKADEHIRIIETNLEEVKNHLDNLIDYAINYFRQIKKKYGKGRERKTEIRSFDTIEATMVAVANEKLYINREEGFAGTSLRKDEYVCECSDIDDIIIFREDGTCVVTKVAPKFYTGKNVIHIDVYKRNDERTIYNMVYRDGKAGKNFVKRFAVVGITRDKEYNLTKGTAESKVLYLTANPNGEAEVVRVTLRPQARLKITAFDYDFSTLTIKGRSSMGNTLTKNYIKKIVKKEDGISTLGAKDIWYDDSVKRLNGDGRGKFLGAFKGDDKILTILQSGEYRLTGFDLTTHFDDSLLQIGKFDPDKIMSVIYLDGQTGLHYFKRFLIEESDKKTLFIPEQTGTKLISFSMDDRPVFKVVFDSFKNAKDIDPLEIIGEEFITLKSFRAKGKRISNFVIKKVEWLESLPIEPLEAYDEDDRDEPEESDLKSLEERMADDSENTENPEEGQPFDEDQTLDKTTEPDQEDENMNIHDQPAIKSEKPGGSASQMTLF